MNKSITKKVVLLLILCTIVAYFILLGLVGEDGYVRSRSLRAELETLRQRQEVLLLQVDSLSQQSELMSSQDALKDAAFRFGYQEEGEQVFYFSENSEGEGEYAGQGVFVPKKGNLFGGLAKRWILLIALVFSSLFTLIYAVLNTRRKTSR